MSSAKMTLDNHKQVIIDLLEWNRQSSHEGIKNYKLSSLLVLPNGQRYYGVNQRKTHPLQKEFGKNNHAIYLHSEIDAIRQAYREAGYLGGSTLYVARTKVNGTPSLAMPCKGCRKAIKHFEISEVYFSTNNGIGSLYN